MHMGSSPIVRTNKEGRHLRVSALFVVARGGRARNPSILAKPPKALMLFGGSVRFLCKKGEMSV